MSIERYQSEYYPSEYCQIETKPWQLSKRSLMTCIGKLLGSRQPTT